MAKESGVTEGLEPEIEEVEEFEEVEEESEDEEESEEVLESEEEGEIKGNESETRREAEGALRLSIPLHLSESTEDIESYHSPVVSPSSVFKFEPFPIPNLFSPTPTTLPLALSAGGSTMTELAHAPVLSPKHTSLKLSCAIPHLLSRFFSCIPDC